MKLTLKKNSDTQILDFSNNLIYVRLEIQGKKFNIWESTDLWKRLDFSGNL